jgi:hypothetical protein
MAITNYDELVAAIGKWAWRSGVEGETDDATFVATIPDFITLTESRLNRELRIGHMLKSVPVEIVAGTGVLPDDYLEFRHFAETAYPSRSFLPGAAGGGRGFNIDGLAINVWPGSVGNLSLTYYAKIPALTPDNPTNWLLSKAPEVYLYGALLEAMPFTQDDQRAGTWHAFYDKAIDGLKVSDTMARYARSGYRLHGCTP